MKTLNTVIFLLIATTIYSQSFFWSDGRRIEIKESEGPVLVYVSGERGKPMGNNLSILMRDNIGDDAIDYSKMHLTVDSVRLWMTRDIVFKLSNGCTIEDVPGYPTRAIGNGAMVMTVDSVSKTLELANWMYESGIAAYAHPDFIAPPTIFQDPLYPDQFQMNNTGQVIDGWIGEVDCDVNAPEAWTLTTGSETITVSVIDNGVEYHEDLNDAFGVSRLIGGYTPATGGDGSPTTGKHGVPCAGIIAASHNSIGVKGVAPNSKLLSVNIFSGMESTSDLAEAFNWSVDNGADVISNSWGYGSCTMSFSVLSDAIINAVNNGRNGLGSVVVFASGNNNYPCVAYPARLGGVIAVGAVTNQGKRSFYSNYGGNLDVVAPSNGRAGVRTTDRMGTPGYTIGNYNNDFGGTSAACPVVSGVSALVLSVSPYLTSGQVYDIITSTATDMGDPGFDNPYAYGRVNAYESVICALDTECEPDSGGGGGVDPGPCDIPEAFSLDFLSSTIAVFSWDEVDGALSYSLRYRKVGSNGYTVKAYLVGVETTITNLSINEEYYAELVAHCANEQSDWTERIYFTPGIPTSAGEIETSIRIYPNPTRDNITIDCPYEINNIEIYNVEGKKMNASFPELDHGAYFVILYTEAGIYSETIIKIE